MRKDRSRNALLALGVGSMLAGCGLRMRDSHIDELDDDLTSTLQAESAAISGAIKANGEAGFTGSGYVDFQNASGDFVDWSVNAASAGSYDLAFRFANGAIANRPLQLTVDGIVVNASLGFNPTGSWATWSTVTQRVTLKSGTRHVRLTATGSSGPNLDSLKVSGPVATGGGSGSAGNFPSRFAAPYVETWNDNNLANLANQTGHKFYTLAFMLNGQGSCNPAWNGDTSLTGNNYGRYIDSLRNLGGDAIVSFGGADGTELGNACSSVSSLQAAYQKVIDQFHLTWVDFDIESGAESDAPSVDRRNKAIKNLQAANPNLRVSYTLAVDRTGLPTDDLNLLKNAKSNGARVDVVNIMAMDYGPCFSDMGQAAIDAANATRSQLANSGISASVGVTPMLGVNDVTCENFTTANAQQLVTFAQANGFVRTLGFWALGADPKHTNLNVFHSFH